MSPLDSRIPRCLQAVLTALALAGFISSAYAAGRQIAPGIRATSAPTAAAATTTTTGPAAPTAIAAAGNVAATADRLKVTRPPPRSHINWLNPTTWPVLPVPLIAIDPLSGTELGMIPTVLGTNSANQITRIIAPDFNHNANFGWGVDGRIFDYPSEDTQWYVTGGASQRVESWFDALFQTGLQRDRPFSFTVETVYNRSGTPRFYGFGNDSLRINQTVYTDQEMSANATLGWNITHAWQLAYTVIAKKVKITSSQLLGLPSIGKRFADILGLGTTHELLNRLSLVYDTRNDVIVPTSGMHIVLYGGVASRNVDVGDSLFTEAGGDASFYWSPSRTLTVASHVDLRYEPTAHHVPFWALSSLGGDDATIGDSQPLRGYGTSRFYDRDSFVANVELRKTVLSLNTLSTHIEIQVTPFIDTGRVFHNEALPLDHLHNVMGIGFRGIAPPSVVGYVDFGKGSEGLAIFTGINYPF